MPSRNRSLILDPFCGLGSTLVAAAILGQRFMGIELSSEDCDTAMRRTERVRLPERGSRWRCVVARILAQRRGTSRVLSRKIVARVAPLPSQFEAKARCEAI